MLGKEYYRGREQTYVKHYFLDNYLERLAFKIGMSISGATLNYIDGFSGPWMNADDRLQDTSPFIAIEKLRATRASLAARNREFNFRCLFIEKDPDAYQKLKSAVADINDFAVEPLCGEFENHLARAATFAKEGSNPFGFFFIDPTGWTGYPMAKLKPLFGNRFSELLINFMTSFIDRFVDTDDPSLLLSFRDLFGDEKCRELWKGLKGIDKEDAMVDTYCRQLQKSGKYSFVGSSVILDPNADQTHYHFVYATYHPEGMRVFREVEAKAHTEQEGFRSEVAKEKRADKGIRDLFEPEVLASKYDQQLLRRYQDKARLAVEEHVRINRRVSYDDLEKTALTFPLTHGQLNKWIREWQTAKLVKLEGLGPRERVPKPDQHHYVVWTGAN